jgi:hypothetical protein
MILLLRLKTSHRQSPPPSLLAVLAAAATLTFSTAGGAQ